MLQSLKIGFIALVVAAMAAGGMALAQTSGSDDAPSDTTQLDAESGRHGKHHDHRYGVRGAVRQIAEEIGVDAQTLVDELESGGTIADVAEASGTTGEAVVAALLADLQAKVDEAVADGDITQARADQIVEKTEENLTFLVNSTQDEIQAEREARRAEREAEREARREERQQLLEDTIGIPFADIQAELEEGETLADIAAGQGVDLDTLVAALVAPKAAALQEQVNEGLITQETADERLAEFTERVTERVQTSRGEGHFGRGGRHGHGPRGGGDFSTPEIESISA